MRGQLAVRFAGDACDAVVAVVPPARRVETDAAACDQEAAKPASELDSGVDGSGFASRSLWLVNGCTRRSGGG